MLSWFFESSAPKKNKFGAAAANEVRFSLLASTISGAVRADAGWPYRWCGRSPRSCARFTGKWRFEAAQKKKKAPISKIPASRTDSKSVLMTEKPGALASTWRPTVSYIATATPVFTLYQLWI
jgi:hypothetical protein